jgi:hypothetical protein
LDRPQTVCYHLHISCVSPYLTSTTAPFGVNSEFNLQLLYLPGLKNVVVDFLSRPLPESTKTVPSTAAADPVDCEEMAADQNHFAEMQRLLGSSSLKLAIHQTGTQRLAGDVSTSVFRPIFPLKFRKDVFSHFHNAAYPGRLASHHIISSYFFSFSQCCLPREACLLSYYLIQVCVAGAVQRHHHLDLRLPWLPEGQDPLPHPPNSSTHPHPQHIQMDRSSSPFRNVRGVMRKSVNFFLDFSFSMP